MSTPVPQPNEPQAPQAPETKYEVRGPKSSPRVTADFHLASHFSGPLPHPSILAGYENCMPGAADRILRMTEAEGEHRRFVENTIIARDFDEARRGQYCATAITVIALLISGLSIYLGQILVAVLFGGGSLAAIITALLRVKTIPHSAKDQESQDPAPTPPKKRRKK